MTDLNNNIPNFGTGYNHKISKADKDLKINKKEILSETTEKNPDKDRIIDTGVLGRSQIKNAKGADITKSVDEAVLMAKTSPAILEASSTVFETSYQKFLDMGLSDAEAYKKAILCEDEFLQIAQGAMAS